MILQAERRAYRRKNKPAIDRARGLVEMWYEDRVDQRQQGYAAVNGQPTMTAGQVINPGARAWRPAPNKPPAKNTFGDAIEGHEPTARGTEKRQAGRSGGLSNSTELDSAGDDVVDRPLYFAKRVMGEVLRVDPDLQRALEMSAAGYGFDDIAGELGCGDRQARALVAEGLGIVVVLRGLRTQLQGWWPR